MGDKQPIPETHVVVLEILAKAGRPLTASQITEKVADRFPASGAIANLQSKGRIKNQPVPDSKYVGYTPTAAGISIIKNIAKYSITPYKPKQFSKTKKSATKYKSKDAPVIPLPPPTINVSATADNLMDHISAVIQENGAYREGIIRCCNQMAALLGMKLVPIQPEAEKPEQ